MSEKRKGMMKWFVVLSFLMTTTLLLGQSLQSEHESNGKLEGEERQTWYHKGVKDVKAYGVQSDRLRALLIQNVKPKKRVVVAVIDSGVDIDHEDLQGNIWQNQDEVPGNGLDDDDNGYVDDIHGWNYIVGDDGENLVYENLEATRVLRLSQELQSKGEPYPEWLTQELLQRAVEIFNEQTQELEGYYQIVGVYRKFDSAVTAHLQDSAFTFEQVDAIETDDPFLMDAKRVFGIMDRLKITRRDLQQMDRIVSKYTDYWLNLDYRPRKSAKFELGYGNPEVGGAHTGHGTHVAGIIAAKADNELGGRGIASDVVDIMVLKVVPDGDERDMDVAQAIRYAVDNGADIINMSFGKGLSPHKTRVDEAFEYAAKRGVLLVHAAGNDADDSDVVGNFPNALSLSENAQSCFITVGALAPQKNKRLVADFSNYGDTVVDLFAPGEDIYSTLPGNKYGYQSGTSMAAPVVSGVAALILAHHPQLTAAQLKQVIVEGGTDLTKKKVVLPGTRKTKVPFGSLSESGIVVNAMDAFVRASELGGL